MIIPHVVEIKPDPIDQDRTWTEPELREWWEAYDTPVSGELALYYSTDDTITDFCALHSLIYKQEIPAFVQIQLPISPYPLTIASDHNDPNEYGYFGEHHDLEELVLTSTIIQQSEPNQKNVATSIDLDTIINPDNPKQIAYLISELLTLFQESKTTNVTILTQRDECAALACLLAVTHGLGIHIDKMISSDGVILDYHEK